MDSNTSAYEDEIDLRDEYKDCLTWFSRATEECVKDTTNLEFLQFCVDKALTRVTSLFYKEYCETRRKSLQEVFQLLNFLNTKVLDRINGPTVQLELTENDRSDPYGNDISLVSLERYESESSSLCGPLIDPPSSTSTQKYSEIPGQDKQAHVRSNIIEQTIITDCKVGLDDVIGLNEAKRSLNEAIVMPTLYPHLFSGKRKPWKRILMYGPPGTGKTRLARAVAREIDSSFYSVSSSDLLSSWFGESEKMVRDLFDHARKAVGRCVVFIDEIDSLCRRRSEKEDEGVRRIKTELLHQMDGIPSNNDPILLCSTNCPWEIDPAFLRRFQKRVHISLPSKQARISIMKLHLGDDCNISEEEWNELGELTDGYSGSDLSILINCALFEPIRQLQKTRWWIKSECDKFRPCTEEVEGSVEAQLSDLPPSCVVTRTLEMSDLIKCLQTSKATVASDDLAMFQAFTLKFGQEGK